MNCERASKLSSFGRLCLPVLRLPLEELDRDMLAEVSPVVEAASLGNDSWKSAKMRSRAAL